VTELEVLQDDKTKGLGENLFIFLPDAYNLKNEQGFSVIASFAVQR
jgi:hypothetical protein